MVGFRSYEDEVPEHHREEVPSISIAIRLAEALAPKRKVADAVATIIGNHGGHSIKIKRCKTKDADFAGIILEIFEPAGHSMLPIKTRFPKAVGRYLRRWKNKNAQHVQLIGI